MTLLEPISFEQKKAEYAARTDPIADVIAGFADMDVSAFTLGVSMADAVRALDDLFASLPSVRDIATVPDKNTDQPD
jgi:hypothetical protein